MTQLTPKSILHVEDDEGSALLLQVALREVDTGVKYYRAADSDQALRFLGNAITTADAPKPGLILLDLNLPGTSGFEILSAIRADPSWSNLPVVIFTSSSASRDMDQAAKLKATKYMLKPSTFDGYLDAVTTFLQVIAAREAILPPNVPD
ncbi:MAG: response regulator [Bryobacteraceae bacterium]